MKELNPRQWALYHLLKNNPDKAFKQIDIAYALKDYYDTAFTDSDFHNSKTRMLITSDIRAINNCDLIQKTIISGSYGVKLASKAEFERYISGEFAAIFRKLARTRKKAMKAGLDGQMRLAVGQERGTIEAFTDDINRLKAARLAKGLKSAEVCERLKEAGFNYVDMPLLSKIEHGYCQPTNEVLLKLAEIYDISPFDIV